MSMFFAQEFFLYCLFYKIGYTAKQKIYAGKIKARSHMIPNVDGNDKKYRGQKRSPKQLLYKVGVNYAHYDVHQREYYIKPVKDVFSASHKVNEDKHKYGGDNYF